MPKYTISTTSPVVCDSFETTDKYGKSVKNTIANRFSEYPAVIVEKSAHKWIVTGITHFHGGESEPDEFEKKPEVVIAEPAPLPDPEPSPLPEPEKKPKAKKPKTKKKKKE